MGWETKCRVYGNVAGFLASVLFGVISYFWNPEAAPIGMYFLAALLLFFAPINSGIEQFIGSKYKKELETLKKDYRLTIKTVRKLDPPSARVVMEDCESEYVGRLLGTLPPDPPMKKTEPARPSPAPDRHSEKPAKKASPRRQS